MARDGQAPPPDHVDKPLAEPGGAKIGERLTGVDDPKDPDGLIPLEDEATDAPDLRADRP